MKLVHNPYIRLTLAVSALTACISAPTAFAADLTWDNGAATGNWNTTEANWTGSTWSNANPDNAVFNNRNETVTLTEAITGGSLSFQAGGNPSGAHLLTLTGSSLYLGSVTVNGIGLGGNVDSMTDSANQRLKLNNISMTASGDASVARGSLEVSGTTALNITGKLLVTGDWSNFVMSSGTSVTVTGGVDFYNSKVATNLDLNGGALTTAYIYGNKYTNPLPERNTNVNFNGTTVVATADNADFLQVHNAGSAGTRAAAAIRTGGLIFDTAGYAVSIANALANYTGETGALTKTGNGTLTLSGANNSFTGGVTVNGGTLLLSKGASSEAAISGGAVAINSGATLKLGAGSQINDTGITSFTITGGTFDLQSFTEGFNPAVTLAGGTITGTSNGFLLARGGFAGTGVNAINQRISVRGADANSGLFNISSGTTTVNATIHTDSGAAQGITKSGDGTLILAGNNSYAGTTTVNSGTLALAGGSAIANSGAVSLANTAGAGLQLNSGETIGSLSGGGASGGHVNLQANTLSVGDAGSTTYSGVISGSGGLTKLGAGNLTLSAANTYSGTTTVNGGTLILSGARTDASGVIVVAGASGTNATLEIQNGTYALGTNALKVGDTSNATGTVNQSGGAVSFASNSTGVLIGGAAGTYTGSVGIYNLSGGSISTANGFFNLGVLLGVNHGAQGTFNLSGSGSLTVGSNSALYIGRSDNAGTANNTSNLFNQTGGAASVSTLAMGGKTGGSTGVSSTLTLTGGTFSASAFSVLAAGNTNTAVINIGGTADVTLPALPTARGTSSTATLNFDGGTLRPAAASGAYISGLTNAFILDGGAKINVASGKDITITQNLLTDAVSTGGGLTKDGLGSLTLTGINTYTGDTTVNQGTLSLGDGTSNTSLADTAKVFIASGATLNLNYSGTDTVKALWLNGVQKAAGVYGSADPSGLISGGGTLTVTNGPSSSAYDTWATSPPYNLSGPNAAFDFDYDNDGLDNGLEWILGGNPTVSDNPSILPVVTGSAASGLTLVFNRATASLPPASSLIIDFDSDLDATWAKSVTIGAASSGPDANGVVVTVDTPSAGKVTVTIPASNAASGKLFARLRASQP